MRDALQSLRHDLPAGIIVFLVAVPLCLGIALASGAPLFSGIIAGFVGGIVVTLLSGSALGVSGPAAGLVVIALTAIGELGFERFLTAVAVAGVIQIALGYLQAGIIGYYFPNSVIKGMLTGIGVIIILKQVPFALGIEQDVGVDAFLDLDWSHEVASLFPTVFERIDNGSMLVGVVSFGILLLWETPWIRSLRVTEFVQGPLVAVIAGIVFFLLLQDTGLAIAGTHMVQLPVAGSLADFLGQFTLPDLTALAQPGIYVTAFTLAVVASLETLLCVEATDRLDPLKRVTPTNRELKAQGVGNLVSGLIGGLPVTQVIVRSSANIQSGARTKRSALIHGILILVSVALAPWLLNMIPLAALGAILIQVGYKLAKPSLLVTMYHQGWRQSVPFFTTVAMIVATDLLTGIATGMVVGVFSILLDNYRLPYFVNREQDGTIWIRLSEVVSFLNKASIQRSLASVPDGARVVIDATSTLNIDHDVMEIIEDFEDSARHRQIEVTIHDRRATDFHRQVTKFENLVTENGNGNGKPAAPEVKPDVQGAESGAPLQDPAR